MDMTNPLVRFQIKTKLRMYYLLHFWNFQKKHHVGTKKAELNK